MRWALLADVHANLEALQAVLREIDSDWSGAGIICAGDLVGYGPDPEAVLEVLAERQAVCVMGNHDAMVLGRLGMERCIYPGVVSAHWTRSVLPRWALEHLGKLPMTAQPMPGLAVCHAAPDDLEVRVSNVTGAAGIAARFPEVELVVGGHTHFAVQHVVRDLSSENEPPAAPTRDAPIHPQPGRRAQGERLRGVRFVNPGSVGQSRDGNPAARYARFDATDGSVTFHSVTYDNSGTLEKMRSHGLVAKTCYDKAPGRVDGLRARLIRTLRPRLPAI
jgi:predicted phosphodiesterase